MILKLVVRHADYSTNEEFSFAEYCLYSYNNSKNIFQQTWITRPQGME